MTRGKALKLLRGGEESIKVWNRRRRVSAQIPSLSNVDLSGADLTHANLDGARLHHAVLVGARLVTARLRDAKLVGAHLSHADLTGADLGGADLYRADLSGASLADASLTGASLSSTDLTNADLTEAVFDHAILRHAKPDAAKFGGARFAATVLAGSDLGEAMDLHSVRFQGPCYIDTQTLIASKGKIPKSFLRGCGLQQWEILAARLYDPDLTGDQIADIQHQIFAARSKPFFLGGVFISYAREDSRFVDKMHKRLEKGDATVWLDRHDIVAGPIREQVDRAIRINDVVLLVLSEHSVESDWVEHELKMARRKEKEQKRNALCPVALDDTWKTKQDEILWEQLVKKAILDFSKWEDDKAFEEPFQKLIKGLKLYYPPGTTLAGATQH